MTLKSLLHNCCLQGKHHQSKNQDLICTYSRQSFTIQTTWNKINPFYEFVNCKTTPGIAHIGTPKKGEIDALFLFVACTISWFGSLVIISRQGNKFSIAQLIRSRS